MTATQTTNAITITYEPGNLDRLYSPDGKHHLLLCDVCQRPEWVAPLVDAVICETCANAAVAQ